MNSFTCNDGNEFGKYNLTPFYNASIINAILLNKTWYDVGMFKHCELSEHCVDFTSVAAHPALRKTCSMLMYLFNSSCLDSINSYYM